MKFILISSILFLSISSSTSSGVLDVFKKYAMSKFTEDCLGREALRAYVEKTIAKFRICEKKFQSASQNTPPQPATSDVGGFPSQKTSMWQNFDWQRVFAPKENGQQFIPVAIPVTSPEQAAFFFNPVRPKQKRAAHTPYYDQDKVRRLKNKVVTKIDNYTCVMEEMNYIDSNGNIFPEAFKKDTRDFKLNRQLEEDLLSGVDVCLEISKAPSLDFLTTTLPPKIHRLSVFVKCLQTQRMRACMKDDMRKYPEEFDLTGLDGAINQLSDDDKRMAIVWADIKMAPAGPFDLTF